jgi:hypothetical protein
MRGRVAALALVLMTSCSRTVYEAHFAAPAQLAKISEAAARAPFIKCHMADGRVYVLQQWSIEEGTGLVEGMGLEYDADRNAKGGIHRQSLKLTDIALIETNRPYSVDVGTGSIVALAIGTGVSLGVSAICLFSGANGGVNKACFGSCPTFFAEDGNGFSLQAEGFSSSVARSLEATDVDAMWTAAPKSRDFDVVMTNDALETHVVDSVRVLAAARPLGGRVLRAGAKYFEATNFRAPTADDDAVTSALRASDGVEYKTLASATDLTERETLEVHFAAPASTDPPQAGRRMPGPSTDPPQAGRRMPGPSNHHATASARKRLGLLVVDRNSLLNTFLFYQGLAFMGTHVGDWMAALEREGRAGFASMDHLLGNIEVAVRDEAGAFVRAGSVGEVGPIAREAELVILPDGVARDDVVVRLTMAKGNWRIDQLALVDVGDPVDPLALDPLSVTHAGQEDGRALEALLDPKRHLVTYPGDAYTLHFRLPPGDVELFLESRGYYYEWMREEWLKEDDQVAALQLVMNPSAALKKLAPRFKALEPDMDRIFWQSRVTR